MTKKDYEVIAKALNMQLPIEFWGHTFRTKESIQVACEQVLKEKQDSPISGSAINTFIKIVGSVSRSLLTNDPKFDREKFLKIVFNS